MFSHCSCIMLGVKWLGFALLFSFCIFKKHQQSFLAENIADRLLGGLSLSLQLHATFSPQTAEASHYFQKKQWSAALDPKVFAVTLVWCFNKVNTPGILYTNYSPGGCHAPSLNSSDTFEYLYRAQCCTAITFQQCYKH